MIKLAPFVRITASDGRTLQESISDFGYTFSEEEDDVCELLIESDNPKLADDKAFQEGQSLTVTWGYLDYSYLVNTRKVYIFDTKCEYSANGISLQLICHEKFAISKLDTAKNKNSSSTNSKNITKILLSNDVLENLDIKDNQSELYRLLDAATRNANSKLDPRKKQNIANTEESFVKSDNTINKLNQSDGIPNANANDPLSPKLSKGNEGLSITLYSGSNSTYRTLKNFFDKQPGGPYVIDSRDDTVTIRTRDMSASPIREYLYKGEDGELIAFTPETKNRSKSKTSEAINVVNWDSSSKRAITQLAKREDSSVESESSPVQSIWNASPVPTNPYWFQQRQDENVKARVIGPDGKKIGTKDWKKENLKNEKIVDSNNYTKIENNGSWSVYSDELINQRINTNKGAFGSSGSTTLPEYIRNKNSKPIKGPSKTLMRGSESSTNAKAFAENRRKNDELDSSPGTATVVGNPLLESGKTIKIGNVATKHGGLYYIKACKHSIGNGGYLTTIDNMIKSSGTSSKSKKIKSSNPKADKKTTASSTGYTSPDTPFKYPGFSDLTQPRNWTGNPKLEKTATKKLPIVTPNESKTK